MPEGQATFLLQPLKAVAVEPIITVEITRLYSERFGRLKNSIVKGENFTLVMEVEYSTLLGDLEAKFVAKFHVLNMDTGNKANAYSGTVTGNLVKGSNRAIIRFDVTNAQEEGVFLLAGSFGLPKSLLNDFSLGGTVAPGQTREVANFFVFPA